MSKRSGGFTLIEIIIAITLVVVLAVTILAFMYHVTRFSRMREMRLTAANLAYSTIEHLKERGRINFAGDATHLDLDEGAHNNYNDIIVPNGYNVSYVVTNGYWNDEDPNNSTAHNHVNYKKIVVACNYDVTIAGDHTLTMTGYAVEGV